MVEIPNEGHTPTGSECALGLGLRFVATLTVDERACARTGTPPPVAARAALRAADLPLVDGEGTPAQRRALALLAATGADLAERAPLLQAWPVLGGLRGGRYVARAHGRVRLDRVRVVRDASVSGALVLTARAVSGSLRLAGTGVVAGELRVRLTASGRGRAVGELGGEPVALYFRLASG